MSKTKSKHIKSKGKIKKGHSNKSYFKIAFIVVAILIVVIFIYKKGLGRESKVLSNQETQIILNNENITEKVQNGIVMENDKIYMSINDIKQLIYQEPETNLIITTSNKKIATLKKDEETITINGSNKNIKDAVIQKDNEQYIAISELENVYNYEIKYQEESNIITIDSLNNECVKAYAKKNISIKKENTTFSKTIEKVKKGNWVIFISEENKVAKVRTQNGNIGYIKSNSLCNFVTEREDLIENTSSQKSTENALEFDLTSKDITTFKKREEVANLILQEAIKNDKMYVKITYNAEKNEYFERFKIEALPILQECGITIDI